MAAPIIKINIPQITAAIIMAVDDEIQEIAIDMRERIHDDMAQPKHGKIYHTTRHVTGQPTYIASAPGEAPAIVSQSYDASIHSEPFGHLTSRVYTDDPRGIALEYGERLVAARPHFTPAAEAMRDDVTRRIARVALDAAAKHSL